MDSCIDFCDKSPAEYTTSIDLMDTSAIVLENISEKLERLLDVRQEQTSTNDQLLSTLDDVASALQKVSEKIDKDAAKENEEKEESTSPPAFAATEVEILTTIERIFNLDTIEQSFSAQIRVGMLWRCPQSENEGDAKIPTPDIDDGDWEPQWTPKYYFKNMLQDDTPQGENGKLKSYYTPVVVQTKEEEAKGLDGKLYVKAETRHLMKIAEPLELKTFPVDCQELSIEVISKMSTEQLCFRPMRKNISLKPYRGHVDTKFARHGSTLEGSTEECEFARLQKERLILNDFTLVDEAPFNYNMYTLKLDDDKDTSAVKLIINLQRKSFYYVVNVWLVCAAIVSFVFCCWGLHPGDIGDRLGLDLTLVLTIVAFRLVLVDMMPKTSYMTWLDMYVMGAFMFLTIVTVLHSVYPYTGFMKIEMSGITWPPANFPTIVDGVLCDSCKEQDMIDGDNILLYVLAVIWVFFNLGFAIYVYIRGKQLHAKFVEKAKANQLKADAKTNEVLDNKGRTLDEI